jgi:hypothetical protein
LAIDGSRITLPVASKNNHPLIFQSHSSSAVFGSLAIDQQLTCSLGHQLCCDRLWLSTGSTLGVEQHSLLKTVADQQPIPIINGLPLLTKHLRWGDRELYVMGGLAALQIGPTARNLSGARMASDKIVDALVRPRTHQALVG